MKQAKTMWLFVAVVVLVPVTVFAVVNWYGNHYQKLPVLGPEKHQVGNFNFKSQNGQTITINDWKDKIVVANFFFSHCSSVCPKMMYQLKRLQAYGDKNTLISSFTVDPERDSVSRLKKYATQLGITNNWLLLTGDKIALYRFARKDLMIVATDGDGGVDDFIHSENLVLIDPLERLRGFYKGTDETEVNRLIHDIEKLKNEFN
ncbi:MAG: SCO family protein [Bacteroidota bacterium]|nr:SCO family protein [Bacteroidota bacterium]